MASGRSIRCGASVPAKCAPRRPGRRLKNTLGIQELLYPKRYPPISVAISARWTTPRAGKPFGQQVSTTFRSHRSCQRSSFSERRGTPDQDGSVRMAAFTHELLSQYVGTSREIVTHYMNQFRRQGYLQYSRRGIVLYRDAYEQWLRQNGKRRRPCRAHPMRGTPTGAGSSP